MAGAPQVQRHVAEFPATLAREGARFMNRTGMLRETNDDVGTVTCDLGLPLMLRAAETFVDGVFAYGTKSGARVGGSSPRARARARLRA